MDKKDLEEIVKRMFTTDALVVDGERYVATDWVYKEEPPRCFCGQFLTEHEESKCDIERYFPNKG